MFAKIPQKVLDPSLRASEIADEKNRYAWDYSWPPGTATPVALKKSDEWSLKYILRVTGLNLQIIANQDKLSRQVVEGVLDHAALIESFKAVRSFAGMVEKFFAAGTSFAEHASKIRPDDMDDYADYFQLIETPAVTKHLAERPEDEDVIFAWQRIAGANPMMVRQIARLPDHFPVTETHFARAGAAAGADAPTDTLAASLAEGRALLADYALLDGAGGGVNLGRQKYVTAPLALFVMDPPGASTRRLRPIAIQVTQKPSAQSPVLTPADGWRWRMAKMAVQAADGSTHEAYYHLGQTHLAVGVMMASMFNTLHKTHPVRLLLVPHCQFTLAINNSAKNSLIAREGIVDRVVGLDIDSTAAAVTQSVMEYLLPEMSPAKQLAGRGLLDTSALPEIPYRDDSLPVWGAIRDFVGEYVALYFADDAEVQSDAELRAWFVEMGSQEGGRMNGLRHPSGIEELAEWVATIIFTATVQHAVVNFGQFAFMADPRVMPGALWAPAVTADTPDTREALAAMLPPWDAAILTADTVYQLSSVRENKLGGYTPLDFRDKAARKIVRKFQRALVAIEAESVERDADRLLTFPFARPSLVPNSVHI